MLKAFIASILLFAVKVDAFYERDKILHTSFSLVGTLVLTQTAHLVFNTDTTKSILIGASAMLLIGLAKETMYDAYYDKHDMFANVVGVAAAVPLIYFTF